ncbi:hypothetical protein GW915_09780 [bacterium]|nr:hypothetical protein [bacterium]
MRALLLTFCLICLRTSFAENCSFSFDQLPSKLSATCLYENIESKQLNSALEAYSPRYPLWSDGALKERWVYLPPGAQINTKDPNHWEFPVGTVFWKQFSLDGKRLETRVIKKVGDTREPFVAGSSVNWIYGSYAWNADESEAILQQWEVERARGTAHTIPSKASCYSCHGVEGFTLDENQLFKDSYLDFRPLGFKAFQLTDASQDFPEVCREKLHSSYLKEISLDSLTLNKLLDANLLTDSHDWKNRASLIPGDSLQRATLAYFSVNCSHCHSSGIPDVHNVLKVPGLFAGEAGFVGMRLAVDVSGTPYEMQPALVTLVNQKTSYYRRASGGVFRVKAGDYEESALWRRFTSSSFDHMPKIGAHKVDPYGQCLIENWIESLGED